MRLGRASSPSLHSTRTPQHWDVGMGSGFSLDPRRHAHVESWTCLCGAPYPALMCGVASEHTRCGVRSLETPRQTYTTTFVRRSPVRSWHVACAVVRLKISSVFTSLARRLWAQLTQMLKPCQQTAACRTDPILQHCPGMARGERIVNEREGVRARNQIRAGACQHTRLRRSRG